MGVERNIAATAARCARDNNARAQRCGRPTPRSKKPSRRNANKRVERDTKPFFVSGTSRTRKQRSRKSCQHPDKQSPCRSPERQGFFLYGKSRARGKFDFFRVIRLAGAISTPLTDKLVAFRVIRRGKNVFSCQRAVAVSQNAGHLQVKAIPPASRLAAAARKRDPKTQHQRAQEETIVPAFFIRPSEVRRMKCDLIEQIIEHR